MSRTLPIFLLWLLASALGWTEKAARTAPEDTEIVAPKGSPDNPGPSSA